MAYSCLPPYRVWRILVFNHTAYGVFLSSSIPRIAYSCLHLYRVWRISVFIHTAYGVFLSSSIPCMADVCLHPYAVYSCFQPYRVWRIAVFPHTAYGVFLSSSMCMGVYILISTPHAVCLLIIMYLIHRRGSNGRQRQQIPGAKAARLPSTPPPLHPPARRRHCVGQRLCMATAGGIIAKFWCRQLCVPIRC
jgi:hypothetical protein